MKNYKPKLYQLYKEKIVYNLSKIFHFSSIMQAPKLIKIVIHQGIGAYSILDKKILDYSINEITSITGQKAVFCYSKHDESNFKLRKGVPIGVKVTLRKNKMYEFLERLILISLPRVRDFSGIKSSSFDDFGNYNMGIKEQVIFPEIDIDKIRKNMGMNITFVTSTKNKSESKKLLEFFGLPFEKK
ncbi:50S ribosomal protein L5 [Blattabacterium cuenoti]|uniref:50S ribosomal protein L5 n=1 Tax=Blattabacterium cuenoti TaxID=1653831 RepID=UPI00163BB6E2|nr:50S ribosomal protein L5 [Blattabacterium cuenoti]